MRRPTRWDVAWLVDRVKGQCWADLVDWVQRSDDGSRLRPQTACRSEAQRRGACYCGKVARADIAALPGGPRASVVVPVGDTP